MTNIREYFYSPTMTEEEFLNKLTEEVELWETLEADETFDFEAWAEAHGVDLEAVDETTGEQVVTLWSWDMCGD